MTTRSHRVSWPVRVDPTGKQGPTRAQSRGSAWRRSSRGLFVPASVDARRPEQRICEAAAVLPAIGGVSGWAALRWAGGVWFEGTAEAGHVLRPVTLAVPGKNVTLRPGLTLSQERIGRDELWTLDDLRLVDVVRALAFEVRHAGSLWAAVEAIDMAAYSDLVSLEELGRSIARTCGWTGIEQLRRAHALADENSWSPRETWLRLVWVLVAGLTRPRCNVPVFDLSGRLLGVPDLLDPTVGLLGEYDGGHHLTGPQRKGDIARQDGFREVGLEVVVVMAGESSYEAARRLTSAHRRVAGRLRPGGGRGWTIDPPPWWVPTETVSQRRALDDVRRQRLLRYRRRLP